MCGLEDFRVWFAVLAYQTWCGQHGYCAKQRWRSSAQARRCAGLRAQHDRCAHRSEGVTYVRDGYFSAAQTDAVLRHERSRKRDWFSWPWACPGRSSSSTSMAMNWAPRCALASEPCSIFFRLDAAGAMACAQAGDGMAVSSDDGAAPPVQAVCTG